MTSPEDAIERARRDALARREADGYRGPAGGGPLEETFPPEPADIGTLSEWAVIAVEPNALYSTRRGGAPVTALKRLLLRLLRQYLVEVESRQTRFNIALLARFQDLERRVERLERAGGPPGSDEA